MACLLLCQAIMMSRKASSLDRKEVKNSRLPPRHSISMELGKPQCRLLRTFVTSCSQCTAVLLRPSAQTRHMRLHGECSGHRSAYMCMLLEVSAGDVQGSHRLRLQMQSQGKIASLPHTSQQSRQQQLNCSLCNLKEEQKLLYLCS